MTGTGKQAKLQAACAEHRMGHLALSNCQIIVAGVGGQGTILTARVLAETAFACDLPVRSAETIGMAQRGGSVVGHLRIMDCLSPLVPYGSADVLIGFEPAETLRALTRLKKGGVVICSDKSIVSAAARQNKAAPDGRDYIAALKQSESSGMISALAVIDAASICTKLGTFKVLNTVLLGAASALQLLPFGDGEITDTLKKLVKPAYVELNLQAFIAGQEAINEH